MKKKIVAIILFVTFSINSAYCISNIDNIIEKGLSVSIIQTKLMAQSLLDDSNALPRTVDKNGNLITSQSSWWTSGFFAGTLWLLYEITNDSLLEKYAKEYTLRIEKEKYNTQNHDVGFMLYCSYGNGYRLTKNQEYKLVLLKGAESLSTRFRNQIGVIRSWDFNKKEWQYPVIIDNMMNLELLEWAAKNSENTKYDEIACSHADVTIKNHFRPNYSCWHLISYDTISGKPHKKQTRQGYSDSSTWARGEAWALYGYTMMYRETKKKIYLEQAINIANFIINHEHMPQDGIPYWDFDAPNIPNEYRDASAAAIMASAFIELSTFVERNLNRKYMQMAERQLKTLSTEYLATRGTNGNFILKHSVGSMPEASEIDVPLVYADYYYVEALVRMAKLNTKKN